VRRVQIGTINSLDKLARPASKAQLWWLKHKNPSLDTEYYSHYIVCQLLSLDTEQFQFSNC
jgi:hypothetical protein